MLPGYGEIPRLHVVPRPTSIRRVIDSLAAPKAEEGQRGATRFPSCDAPVSVLFGAAGYRFSKMVSVRDRCTLGLSLINEAGMAIAALQSASHYQGVGSEFSGAGEATEKSWVRRMMGSREGRE